MYEIYYLKEHIFISGVIINICEFSYKLKKYNRLKINFF